MNDFQSSDFDLKGLAPKKSAKTLPPLSVQKRPVLMEDTRYEEFEADSSNTGKMLVKRQSENSNEQVPVIKVSKIKTTITMVNPPAKEQNKKQQKQKKQKKAADVIARGKLIGRNNVGANLSGQLDLVGNFKGAFQLQNDPESLTGLIYYFEGEINELKIMRIDGKIPNEDEMHLTELTNFIGYFKGIFIPLHQLDQNFQLSRYFGAAQIEKLDSEIKQQSKPVIQYHLPTRVRFEVRKISEINLEKSSAQIAAILYIDVQLNDDALKTVYEQQQGKQGWFRDKYKFTIDFHRGRPLVLPFYDEQDFDQTDQQEQYEWDDVWQGIDLEVDWSRQKMRMSYSIRMIYTAEIDNSHGIFYAPFNLNMLRIIVDLHNIKVDKNTKLCLNCCDLTDFNNTQRGYTPYTFFQNLFRNLENHHLQNIQQHTTIYQKHIDRLTKIDITHFEDQGEFKIANNRLSLFPYHKRVLKNKNELTADIGWTLGTASRTALLQTPTVQTVKEGLDNFVRTGERRMFQFQQWQFVHLEMPIYKYPVIDMIRIFVPIIILSAISLTIFEQENAKDANNFTELAKRIASSCNLMIAYVALIPMIRSGLPPSPSVTLVEILIYLSVIPNFLAIISVFFCASADYLQFFATYQPFTDGFFLFSFILSCLSFVVLGLVMLLYAFKDYKSDYTIYKFEPSPMRNLRAPKFLEYIKTVSDKRPDIIIGRSSVPYSDIENEMED